MASIRPERRCEILDQATAVWRSWPGAPTSYTRRQMEALAAALEAAGNPSLMTTELKATLADHAAGNYRVMMNLADELLTGVGKDSCKIPTDRI